MLGFELSVTDAKVVANHTSVIGAVTLRLGQICREAVLVEVDSRRVGWMFWSGDTGGGMTGRVWSSTENFKNQSIILFSWPTAK